MHKFNHFAKQLQEKEEGKSEIIIYFAILIANLKSVSISSPKDKFTQHFFCTGWKLNVQFLFRNENGTNKIKKNTHNMCR